MYTCIYNIDVIDYSNCDFVGCVYSHKLTLMYIFMMVRGAISMRNIKENSSCYFFEI